MSKTSKPAFDPPFIQVVRDAEAIVILTGAGISAESGIPTFREAQGGLWAQYDPQELATPQAFRAHPRTVLAWYQWRRTLIEQADPNPGHRALAEMESRVQRRGHNFTVITQNIDNLHQRAGSTQVIELHGNIFRTKCAACHQQHPAEFPQQGDQSELPRCPDCGGPLRPDVVWFGEGLPEDALQRSFTKAAGCDVFFSIGTSTVVQPAASLPFVAADHGATLIEINPRSTPLTGEVDYSFREPAGQILPQLLQEAWPEG